MSIGQYRLTGCSYHLYDENAPNVFKEIEAVIVSELSDVIIEHIGSTA
ncbi:GrpB family protein, partial [Candidatus Woesearchaeota archaeon]|nr:GrpB family protein [Candidatus Woesearchaeota archaeon]